MDGAARPTTDDRHRPDPVPAAERTPEERRGPPYGRPVSLANGRCEGLPAANGRLGTGATEAGADHLVDLVPRLARPAMPELRKVMFFGKNMSRSRCSGGLVEALESHGCEVRWVNMATLRRWLGSELSEVRARQIFHAEAPDLVFVFWHDLPRRLLEEFREFSRVCLWVEEPLDDLTPEHVRYMALADLVVMSNPGKFPMLREHGLENMLFQMSGFSPSVHYPVSARRTRSEVVFLGGPGHRGQRAAFLARLADEFDVEIYGKGWRPYRARYPKLRIRRPVGPTGYRRICASSAVMLGTNEINQDPFYFSNRTFLTLACGGFHLTHYVPRLERVFGNGEHLAWYRDEDECLRMLRYYLANERERRAIAARGLAEVLARHRYVDRVRSILAVLRGELTTDEPVFALPRPALAPADA